MMPEPLDIDVSFSSRDWLEKLPDAEDGCHLAAQTTFDVAGPEGFEGAEVSIVLSDDEQVRQLNRTYRGKDKPTNVLSFANVDKDSLQGHRPVGSGPLLLGDIVIAYGVALAEAEAEGKDLADHLGHLVVHGMLHLLGHDHHEDTEADCMEELERSILRRLGIDDPYADQPLSNEGRQDGTAMS